MNLKTCVFALGAVALVSTVGCVTSHDPGDRTTGRVIDDKTISHRVQSALNRDPVYKFEDVAVSTHNGIVQLSGWATTSDQATHAAEAAQRVEGVSGLVNNISIKRTPTGSPDGYPPYARPRDAWTTNTTREYRANELRPNDPRTNGYPVRENGYPVRETDPTRPDLH